MKPAPCADLAELRSAYVDGALSDADRERVLTHLVGCTRCRADVAELRAVRELLRRGAEPPTVDDLSARLLTIAGGAAAQPLWARPFRGPALPGPGGLPSRRRARRLRLTAATAAAVGTLTAAGLIGYAAAPWGGLAVVGDPVAEAQRTFTTSLGQFPLANDALGAVLLADRDELAAYPAAFGPAPSTAHRSMSAEQARAAMERAADHQHAVSYSGRQSFFASRDGQTLRADVKVEARPGQGATLTVLSQRGVELLDGFSPAAVSSRVVDDELLGLLTRNYTLTGVGGAVVAGRSATEISAWSDGQRRARWWLDDATGITLWQELYDGERGTFVLSFGFTEVSVTPAAEMLDHLPPRLVVVSPSTSLSVADVRWLSGAGWSCGGELAGLSLVRLRTDRPVDASAVHAVYSDGVATVGVVEQRGRLEGPPVGTTWDPGLQAYVSRGASQTATWQTGDSVVTVITEGSDDLLTRAVASLPPERADPPTTMERVREGWATILAGLKG